MPRLTVLLPQSFASDVPGLREATSRIGFVGRVLATFRADTLLLYPDSREKTHLRNAGFIREVLEYLVTAPYLRKQLYPLKPSLRYAGLLPPLNIPTHPRPRRRKQREHIIGRPSSSPRARPRCSRPGWAGP
jgi:predicted SPOUT superfamily RNA methylase MTH1